MLCATTAWPHGARQRKSILRARARVCCLRQRGAVNERELGEKSGPGKLRKIEFFREKSESTFLPQKFPSISFPKRNKSLL